MSIGIGLGAFMGSFQQGYGLGKQMRADHEENKLQKEMRGAHDAGRREFDEGVKAGKFDANAFEDYSQKYIYPQYIASLERSGRYKEAQGFREHIKTNEAKSHNSLFGEAIFHHDVGNYAATADALNKMAEIRGQKGYKFSLFKGNDQVPAGYRVTYTGEDGSTSYFDVTHDKARDLIIGYGNTGTAFGDFAAQKNKTGGNALGLVKQDKKGRENLSTTEYWKMYNDVQKSLTEGDPNFSSLPHDEQHNIIMKRLDMFFNSPNLSGGMKAPPVLVDKRTGKAVDMPSTGQQGGGAGGAMPQQQDTPQQGQHAPLQQAPVDALMMSDAPTTPQAALQWAEQARKSGMDDAAIAYGLNNSGLFQEGQLPEQWNRAAAERASDEGMDRQDAFWGITQKGKQAKENTRAQVDTRTRAGNTAVAKQELVDGATKAIREKKIPLKEIYQRMEQAGISVNDLPRDIQRIMRDAAPGLGDRIKETFGFGDKKVAGDDFLKQSDEQLLKTHANTEYKSQAAKKQHEQEKQILQQLKSGELDKYRLDLKLKDMSNPSPEFLELVGRYKKRMPKDKYDGGGAYMPALGLGSPLPQGVIGIMPR